MTTTDTRETVRPWWARTVRWYPVLIAAVAAVLAAYLGLCGLVIDLSLTAKRIVSDETPLNAGFVAEAIEFESNGGRISLRGWLLSSSGDRAIILVHGIDSHGWDGAQPDIARAYVDAGFHVLVFDLRGHGRSGGNRLGLGWHEREDIRGAVDVLLSRGFEPGKIGIHGTSYGAATALLSAAVIPEIGGVLADSAFADVRDDIGRAN